MKPFLVFLLLVIFFSSLSTILLELALTRVFSIILWYDYALMAISVAFFGLGTYAGAVASTLMALLARKYAKVTAV